MHHVVTADFDILAQQSTEQSGSESVEISWAFRVCQLSQPELQPHMSLSCAFPITVGGKRHSAVRVEVKE